MYINAVGILCTYSPYAVQTIFVRIEAGLETRVSQIDTLGLGVNQWWQKNSLSMLQYQQ